MVVMLELAVHTAVLLCARRCGFMRYDINCYLCITNHATSNSVTMTVNSVVVPAVSISASATTICMGNFCNIYSCTH